MSIEFRAWPKIPRLNRTVTITEKIDGTNACVIVAEAGSLWRPAVGTPVTSEHDQSGAYWSPVGENLPGVITELGGEVYVIAAQSRTRLIAPGKQTDNYGFAGWVRENAHDLAALGPGYHYGEWYGQGIQRGYGLDEKRFALFNVDKWSDDAARPVCCGVVPVLWRGEASRLTWAVDETTSELSFLGSRAVPGFTKPEGIVVFHHAAQQAFKVLLEGDASPKGVAA